uniref:Mal, T cell differentiation protein 2 n=1 Tax=Haplochromis burtoni TaxID=8153 RepID=A0A3Q2VFE1_HAPBU
MSEPAANPAVNPAVNPAATSFPTATITLPLGPGVLRTYSGALLCLEILLGGLVWILVASSNVPVPLLQGWVMFVSVTTFVFSSAYLALLITGLISLSSFLAVIFFFFRLLELPGYNIWPGSSIMAIMLVNPLSSLSQIFAFVVTLCYGCSMVMGFKRWRK